MKFIRLIMMIFVFVFLTPESRATGSKIFYLGTGATFFNMGKVTSSDDASTSMMGQFYLPLTLSIKIPLTASFHLLPNFSYTPLSVKAADEISKRILTTGITAIFESTPILDLKAGLGLLIYSISGDGRAVSRSNGSSTATFYLPGKSISSKSIYLDLGLAYRFDDSLRMDLDFLGLSALSSKRAITSMITISKGIF